MIYVFAQEYFNLVRKQCPELMCFLEIGLGLSVRTGFYPDDGYRWDSSKYLVALKISQSLLVFLVTKVAELASEVDTSYI